LNFLNNYKATAGNISKDQILAKSTPYFGQLEKKNPILENYEVKTTSFEMNAGGQRKIFQKSTVTNANSNKIDKQYYYMDTPSKKKEQEIGNNNNLNLKSKFNDKEISSFSGGNNSAFKRFGNF
jgi:hypothetical protein